MKIEDYIPLLPYCDVPKRQCREVSSLLNKIDAPDSTEQESLYLYGHAGTGKTLTSVKLMLNFLSNSKHVNYIMGKLNPVSNEYDPYYAKSLGCAFVRVPDLLSRIRETFDRKSTRNCDGEYVTERGIIERYSGVDFLVLDDFGAEKVTDWSFSVLYLIIDNRYNNYKRTIITSNYTLNELAKKLDDDRIPSRIRAMCTLIKMEGKDKRKGHVKSM